tara:strand:+ start:963 stop:2111 length:1149 start_codon:yes stop_codon:yes gene_type:complete
MENIELPESKFRDEMESQGDAQDALHIQSLLHAVSNKDKVRNDLDDVSFMREANRAEEKRTSPKRVISPKNIFTQLKTLSDRIETEDEQRHRSVAPSPRPRSPSPPFIKSSSPQREEKKQKSRTPTPKNDHKSYYEEKAHLLQSFFLLQQQGIKSELKLDISSDLNILKAEVMRMQTELNSQKMIKFMRKGLIAFVSGLEFLNNRYDPCGLHLNGFSEHCMTSLGDYDGVFMRLYDKYKDTTQALAPEVELLLLLMGSMMMFHLTQQFVQQSMPKFSKKRTKAPQPPQSDSDDDDDVESVQTDNFRPTKSAENHTLPTDILSTAAFPAMIQRLVENQPRPQFQPPRKLEPIVEEIKEVDIDNTKKKLPKSKDTKDEQVLVLG